jgi:hypothetical protein
MLKKNRIHVYKYEQSAYFRGVHTCVVRRSFERKSDLILLKGFDIFFLSRLWCTPFAITSTCVVPQNRTL